MENKEPRKFHEFLMALRRLLQAGASYISKLFDKIVYSDRMSMIASGVLAVVICVAINYQDLSYQLFRKDATSTTLSAIPVEVLVDENNFEVTGVPATADIEVIGDAADIQLVRTQNSAMVTADLRNAGEGSNTVALTASGLPTGLEVKVNPETVNAVLARKYTKTFFISADLIVGAGQSVNAYAKPILSARSVTIKATRDKLNSIRFVRAIVDTSGYEGAFTAEVPLVAYDSNGKQVSVSITPSTVTADVRLANDTSQRAERDGLSSQSSQASKSGN